jgi:hypothetical protein
LNQQPFLQETLDLLILKSLVADQMHELHFARDQERGARFVSVFLFAVAPRWWYLRFLFVDVHGQ